MNNKEVLLSRLEQIAVSLKNTGKARAFIGFGSAGIETDRMDEYSDLDFMVIVKKHCKTGLIENLEWLSSVASIGYCFMNTQDGFKLFFSDGIYSEFGILEEDEIAGIPHGEGRIIWCDKDFDKNLVLPTKECDYETNSLEWTIDELLTDLYVGLCRYARGEKLSGMRVIQEDALDSLLSCSHLITEEYTCFKDPFQKERRYEMRYPSLAKFLPDMVQGYDKGPESALAILTFAEAHFSLDSFMKERITILAKQIIDRRDEK